ncbi:MAG: hypothetical protein K9L30_15820 [Desulfobacterales bacterium]|nr:hypothetical protein [Desulfobacterales bacterium]
MKKNKKEVIVNILKKLSFVNWDRYFEFEGGKSFFGWIERDDNYKDFILLDFVGKEIGFATSSKKFSKKIARILNQEHSDCKRVEYFCDIPNVITR